MGAGIMDIFSAKIRGAEDFINQTTNLAFRFQPAPIIQKMAKEVPDLSYYIRIADQQEGMHYSPLYERTLNRSTVLGSVEFVPYLCMCM